MAPKVPERGLVLAGRYRLEEKLGEGGMGTVWRAEHLVLCAPVAVKVLDRDLSKDEEAHDRFIREARSAAALRSPHVVQTLDYGIDDGVPYIAMELLEGETLQQRLARLGTMTALDTTRVITQVARAVARAHEAGIIHRDLKPENVFIVKNEDAEIAKVLDFGVAKVDKAQLGPKGTRTRTGSLLGTPFYMSPEQAQGNKTIDPRSDLWSLGVIAYECVTGKRPFESDGLGDLMLQICVQDMPVPSQIAEVPPRFDDWFAKACNRDPELRYQTARELADGLREVVGLEARETLATISDDEMTAPPKSVVVRSDRDAESSGTAKTIVDAPKDDDELAVPSAKRPSLTVRQFGTTQSSVPQSSSRTALLVGVGGLALAVGAVAGFLVLGGPDVLGSTTPETEPSAEAGVAATPPSASAESEPRPVKKEREPEHESDAADTESADAAAEASTAASADASVAKPVSSEDKPDKEKKGPADASTDRDWGKTGTEEPAPKPPEPKPPEENKPPALPTPPAPLKPDAG